MENQSFQDSRREKQKADEIEKRKSVQKAFEELQKREEESRKLHVKVQQEKENIAKSRKEENEIKIRTQILDANR